MGAEAYTWITKYKKDLAEALECARQETFAAGKFQGAEENPSTIEEAMEYDPEGGTGSLLDIMGVSETPEMLCACWLSKDELLEFFGTERPTFDEIMQCMPFWESFDRGEARAITLYENDQPAKICFAAWTIDNPAVGSGGLPITETTKQVIPEPETDNEWPHCMWWEPNVCQMDRYTEDVLTEPAVSLLKEVSGKFGENAHFRLLNQNKVLCIEQTPALVTIKSDSELLAKRDHIYKFLQEKLKKSSTYIDHLQLNFPNEQYLVRLYVPTIESDPLNEILMKVTHTKTIALNNPMEVSLKFRKKEISKTAVKKVEEIVTNWFFEAKAQGFQNEFVHNDDFYITCTEFGFKFIITCKEPVQYPFLELYLRLRSGLGESERPAVLSFSGKGRRAKNTEKE